MAVPTPTPGPSRRGAAGNLRSDAVAGFLVALLAVPLGLAVARASGYPPAAGLWTAVLGGVVGYLLGGSELAVKGPAVAMTVVVAGAVADLGAEFGAGLTAAERAVLGYELTLGVGVSAGVVQILFGLCRLGGWAEVRPLAPVHGVLAGLGLLVVAGQLPAVVGVAPAAETTSGGGWFAAPDFRGLATPTGLRYLLLFSLVGGLETLAAAKAVEALDPWRRKADFDRELLAVGVANTLSSAVGGLPMVSTLIRSKANVAAGARTRTANLWHGLFVLGFVLTAPDVTPFVPAAVFGAILVVVGVRLANPSEFGSPFRGERFAAFVGAALATLTTGPLAGLGVGAAVVVAVHLGREAWRAARGAFHRRPMAGAGKPG